MPFALIFIGLVLLVAAVRGNQKELFELLKEDFTGSDNFFVWVLAIIILVAIGNVDRLRPISNAFLGLVILVILVGNGKRGLFDNFISQVRAGTGGGSSNSAVTFSSPADFKSTLDAAKSLTNLDNLKAYAQGTLSTAAKERLDNAYSFLKAKGFGQ